MKPILLLITAITFSACKTTEPAHVAVTASARSSVTGAATATHEAQAASERSSVHIKDAQAASERSSAHIKALRTGAQRIDDEAGKAIRLLDQNPRLMSHP